tara:strand:- start:472 stop:1014 length:543 start_codon:yes stop_codon:yes gene_type:complete
MSLNSSKHNNITKLSEGVYQLNEAYSCLDYSLIKLLKEDCKSNTKKRSRINFHRNSKELVQEMIIALHHDTKVDVHRHISKSESFHIIEGKLAIVLFQNDSSKILDTIQLESKSNHCFYRLNSELDHLVIPLSEIVIIHETTQGPFIPGDPNVPIWAKGKTGFDQVESIRYNMQKSNEFI